jgi:formylglycine-generating enzyme required for sulfatase activity
LIANNYRPAAISVAEMKDGRTLTSAMVWHRPLVVAARSVKIGKDRAGAAIAMLRLNMRDEILSALRVRDDPEVLTQFVHRCRERQVTATELLACLQRVDQLRQAKTGEDRKIEDRLLFGMLFALGEYQAVDLPAAEHDTFISQLMDWYTHDPSSAIHEATGWLLRQWKLEDEARRVDQTPVPYSQDREWFTLEINLQTESEPLQTFYLTFVVFPEGEYLIGSPADEQDRQADETRHVVRITRQFAVSDSEVTWAQFSAFGDGQRREVWQRQFSRSLAPDEPVFGINWFEAVNYCRWLSMRRGLSEDDQCYGTEPLVADKDPHPGRVQLPDSTTWPVHLDRPGFRLPTEAEREIVCRSGTVTRYGFGTDSQLLGQYGWFSDNSDKWSRPVKRLRPNLRGLFDLHGNLWEWCHDWHDAYPNDIVVDWAGPEVGSDRVGRGGGFFSDAASCRSSFRRHERASLRYSYLGFRLALVPSNR